MLRYQADRDQTRLFVDVDGDGLTDMTIRIQDGDFTDFANVVA